MIGQQLKSMGCEKVIINGGGLATNFCTEFSLNNTDDFLAGQLKMRGMQTEINYVPEISRGIPIPGGVNDPFSLEGAPERFARRGIQPISVKEILEMIPKPEISEMKLQFPSNG
jgi:hypothetical protein